MNEIVLGGSLQERFGGPYKMAVRSPAEAIRGLAIQLPGFKEVLRRGRFHLIRETEKGVFALDTKTMKLGMQNGRFHLLPVIEGGHGQDKGIVKVVEGIALIVTAIYAPEFLPEEYQSYFAAGSYAATALTSVGTALAFSGVAMLISPQPGTQANSQKNDSSYLFGGDINPTGQNFPVPLAYGRIRVPGIPLATQIVTNQVDIPTGTVYDGTTDWYNE